MKNGKQRESRDETQSGTTLNMKLHLVPDSKKKCGNCIMNVQVRNIQIFTMLTQKIVIICHENMVCNHGFARSRQFMV